jgi:Tol biopolymer transport system component
MPASGGEAVRITLGGGDIPRESPDGKWLYYTKRDPDTLWRIPIDGGGEAKVLDALEGWWTVGKEGIYFNVVDKQGHSKICLQEFATGKIRTIGTTERPVAFGMAVSPDGRTLLYTQDDPGLDLMLVENFR